MNIFNIDIAYLVVVANAFLIAASALAVLRFNLRCRALEALIRGHASPEAAAPQAEVEAARNAVQTVGRLERRIIYLQNLLEQLAKSRDPAGQQDIRSLPYENAYEMARTGASVEDLTRNCGLNIGEARLMKKLHGRDRSITLN